MKHLILPLFLCSMSASAQNTYDIGVSDLGFAPDELSVVAGDSISVTFYDIDHTFWEVSAQTWAADGATMNGGLTFDPSFVGESFTVELPTPDTLYYVCGAHVELNGEKGYIVIGPATSVMENTLSTMLTLRPNPASDVVDLSMAAYQGPFVASVYDAQGRRVTDERSGRGSLSVDHLDAGAYTVVCTTPTGDVVAREPLVVMH